MGLRPFTLSGLVNIAQIQKPVVKKECLEIILTNKSFVN